MKLNKTRHMRELEEMEKEHKLGSYAIYCMYAPLMRKHQDVIERVRDLTLVLPHGRRFVPTPDMKLDDRETVKFHFEESFATNADALAAMRMFDSSYSADAEKSSYMSGDVPMTKCTYKLELDDRRFEFSYTREGLPTPNCKVVEQSYKSIVCEVPTAPSPTSDFEQI